MNPSAAHGAVSVAVPSMPGPRAVKRAGPVADWHWRGRRARRWRTRWGASSVPSARDASGGSASGPAMTKLAAAVRQRAARRCETRATRRFPRRGRVRRRARPRSPRRAASARRRRGPGRARPAARRARTRVRAGGVGEGVEDGPEGALGVARRVGEAGCGDGARWSFVLPRHGEEVDDGAARLRVANVVSLGLGPLKRLDDLGEHPVPAAPRRTAARRRRRRARRAQDRCRAGRTCPPRGRPAARRAAARWPG